MKKAVGLRTWVEIDKKAIAHNYTIFRRLIKKKKLMAVVKSNAYGHNIHAFAKEMVSLGADFLGVDSVTEALALRRAHTRVPILVLGYTLPELLVAARRAHISVTLSSFAGLEAALRLKKSKDTLRVHIKIDTGMHRQGFYPADSARVCALLSENKGKILVEGVYTHFAEAKNPRYGATTRSQIALFNDVVHTFRKAGFQPLVHAGATGGALLYPDAHLDMVRIGIGLYGLWPSDDARQYLSDKVTLMPVLSWRAVVAEVKDLPAGEKIGYDKTESLPYDATIAVIPVGYWHGFPRLLSSKGRVLIRGKSAKVLGRVSMDMIVVDVTHVPLVEPGDIATLIGKDGKEEISAEEIAKLSATTHYEVVTRLNPLMERIYS